MAGLKSSASPASLFANGEVGVWYDPSDLNTLFQDINGVTPVTAAGQPVGLMLDKSQGLALGSELITNGDFSNGLTGWLLIGVGNTTVVSDGVAQISGTSSVGLRFPSIMTIGNTYRISLRIRRTSGSAGVFYSPTIATAPTLTTEWQTVTYYAPAANANFEVGIAGVATGTVVEVDDISVKLLAGNHATQATAASRPTYGINPITGTRNLLIYTEQFDNSNWAKNAGASVSGGAADPFGGNTAFTFTATGASASVQQSVTLASITAILGSIWIRRRAGTGVISLRVGDATKIPISVTTSWVRVFETRTPTTTTGRHAVIIDDIGDAVDIWGAQLELGSTATAYQRVTTQYDVTEAGVQSAPYLQFDGVDDGMVTSTITPAIDKVQVFAGVRKLSDAASGVLLETGTTGSDAGSFTLAAPSSSGANSYAFASRGTSSASAGSGVFAAAPNTSVLTGLGDIAGDVDTLRRNGSLVQTVTTDQGTGNYLAYPLYVGRRAGTSVPYNGRLYEAIVRFGANLTDGQITSTESWVNGKTGAY